jgi:diacylglycerol kinase (ATP)
VEHVDLADDGLDQIPRPFWRSMGASFAAAFAGLARTIATQRNMKIHVVAAFMVLLVGMALELDLATRAALIFCTGAVWFAEILNSSLEALVDLHIRQFHRLAMLAKDAAAAGVLVLAGGGVLILAEVVRAHWGPIVAARDQVALFLGLGVPATVCLGLVLWGNRKGPLAWTWTALALLCLVPLGLASVDRLFTACAVGTVLLGRYARVRFPGTMPRGQPIPPGAARPQPPPSSVRAVRRP